MRTDATRGRRSIVVRLALALGVVGALVAAPTPGPTGPDADAAAVAPYTITVNPTSDLVDGQVIDITVVPAAGTRIFNTSTVYICRPDGTYGTSRDLLPFVGGNCPDRPVSSSASGPAVLAHYADGTASVSRIRVGTGTVAWGPATNPSQFNLTCDPTHPCRIGMLIQIGGKQYVEASTLLSFNDTAPLANCGGTEPAALNSVGSDRTLAPWIGLTQSYCTKTGKHQPTQAVFSGEGDGQKSFNDGSADLAYSSVGNRFPGHDDEAKRDDVAVPTALNAVVVGLLGGYSTSDPQWPENVAKPFDDVKVTMPELATVFGQGAAQLDTDYKATMQARNPQLLNGVVNLTNSVAYAPAGGEGASWFASSAFHDLAPDRWHTAPVELDGNPKDVPRGPTDALATATPPFALSFFSLYSSRSQLLKVVAQNDFLPGNYGPIWVLTDLATADLLGIPTVQIQNSNGEFVKPTAASLQASASTMTEAPDGTELPNLGHDAPGAYPLTFVEHAVAPHEPLVDESCTARTDAQALLTDWLTYLTSDGQAHLVDGFVPLPKALLDTAQAQVAKVGTAPATGACGPPVPPDGPPDAVPGDAPGGDLPSDRGSDLPDNEFASVPDGGSPVGSGGTGSHGGGGGSTAGGPGGPSAAGPAAGGGPATQPIAETGAGGGLPGFGGAASGVVGGTLALLALALVGGVGGYVSSRRTSGPSGGRPS